jgi:hypothetical protein
MDMFSIFLSVIIIFGETSIKFFLLVVGLIGFTTGYLNDARCAPEENATEDVKASVSTLC